MKIKRIHAKGIPPLRELLLEDLGAIVIIAGANGSGKTRLKEALINTFRTPRNPQVSLTIEATRAKEASAWPDGTLAIQAGTRSEELRTYMESRISGGTYVGTVVQIDSNRSVSPVSFRPLSLATNDPDDTETDYRYFLDAFATRWQEQVNRIYEKVAARSHKISQAVEASPGSTGTAILAQHPDPTLPFQRVFARLLPGKTLCPIDPKQPRDFHYFIEGDPGRQPLPFGSLSSGEQEVVKVVFDLTLKQITHCAILIDEPELHLHPTLAFRLIEVVKDLGGGTNQLFLFTHSADLISTYAPTGNAYFIDSKGEEGNQARQLSQLSARHANTARVVAANLGLFAVGKNLIFVEGKSSSVDRLTYHKVAQKHFPDAYVLPIGSVTNLLALKEVVAELTGAVFGIELFLMRDRDGLSDEAVQALHKNPRARCLGRRHLENYFFDEDVLSLVAKRFYVDADRANRASIASALKAAAEDTLGTALILTVKDYVNMNGMVSGPIVKNTPTKNLEEIQGELVAQVSSAVAALSDAIGDEKTRSFVRRQATVLQASLKTDQWKTVFPGKPVLAAFCAKFWNLDLNGVQQAYVDIALETKPEALNDISAIIRHFQSQTVQPD